MNGLMDIVAQHWACQNFPAFCASALHVFLFTELVALTTFHIFCNLISLEFRNHFESFSDFTKIVMSLKTQLLVIVTLHVA